MGVKGLNYLVESHNLEEEEEKNGGNLRSLKETLLRRDPTRSPTLVFDMWNFAHSAFAGVDWVTGGRPAIIFHQLGEFIANLEGAGIHPVFVIDGINPVVKIDVFVSRKQSRARDMKKVFDALRNGKGLTQDVYQKSILTENLRDMLRRLGADFHCSLGDSDQLTAQVAEDRRAFGIVSDDSDFLIFPSHPSLRVISASGLNMESLRFKKMRRPAALAHFLDLPLARLPLWATLFGSDLAKGIHAIHHLRGQAHLSADATRRIDLTQDILPQLTTSWKEEEERTLQEVLGTYRIRKRDENNNDEKKVPASDFMVYWRQKMDQVPGIDRQAPGYPKWCRTLERVGEMFERGLLESICSVVLGMHYALPSAALDYSGSPGLPFLEDFTDRIRRSIFGILLLETNKIKADPSQELLVDEWIVTKENPYNFTRDTLQCRTRPLWPEEDVDYFQILNEDHLGLKELRMNLFGRAIDPQLDSTVLSRLEPSSIHLFSKLYMLGNCLEEWEMKAILMSHYDVLDRRPHYLPRLRFNFRHLEPRAVHLATLYSHGILADLNGVLGCPWPRECFDQFDWFDGLAFQKSYFAMKEEQKLGRHGISWRNFFCSKSQHVQDEIEGILQLLLSRFPSNGAEGKVPRAKKSFPVAEQGAAGTDRADLDGDEKENKEKGSAKRRKRKGRKRTKSKKKQK